MNFKELKGRYVKITINLDPSCKYLDNFQVLGRLQKVTKKYLLLSDTECHANSTPDLMISQIHRYYLRPAGNNGLYIPKFIIDECRPLDKRPDASSIRKDQSLIHFINYRDDERIYLEKAAEGMEILSRFLPCILDRDIVKKHTGLISISKDDPEEWNETELANHLRQSHITPDKFVSLLEKSNLLTELEIKAILCALPYFSTYFLVCLNLMLHGDIEPPSFQEDEASDYTPVLEKRRKAKKKRRDNALPFKDDFKPKYPGTVILNNHPVNSEIGDLQKDNPTTIYNELQKRVSAHSRALKKIALSAHRHCIKSRSIFRISGLKPEVFLLAGPTGCGKTYIMKVLADILGLPFAHADASSLVQSGIVGSTIYDCLGILAEQSVYTPDNTEKGILFIDEIDKLYIRNQSNAFSNYYGESVQNELLRIMEGAEVPVGEEKEMFDTSGLFFVLGGAFEGIEDLISKRLNLQNRLGFKTQGDGPETQDKRRLYSQITKNDIINYGFQRQLLARVNAFAGLAPLECNDFMRILKSSVSSPFIPYREYLNACGIKLVIENDDVYRIIAQYAVTKEFGARTLTDIIDHLVSELSFDIIGMSGADIILTTGYVTEGIKAYENAHEISINKAHEEKTTLMDDNI